MLDMAQYFDKQLTDLKNVFLLKTEIYKRKENNKTISEQFQEATLLICKIGFLTKVIVIIWTMINV